MLYKQVAMVAQSNLNQLPNKIERTPKINNKAHLLCVVLQTDFHHVLHFVSVYQVIKMNTEYVDTHTHTRAALWFSATF